MASLLLKLALAITSMVSFNHARTAVTSDIFEGQHNANHLMRLVVSELPYSAFPVPNFRLKIKKELTFGFIMTHRDIVANLYQGEVLGLDTIRVRDCDRPTGDITFTEILCHLDLNGVIVRYNAAVKGFNLMGSVREAEITVHFNGTLYEMKAANIAGGVPSITMFVLKRFNTTVEAPDFGFNEKRDTNFKAKIESETRGHLINMMSSSVVPHLNKILHRHSNEWSTFVNPQESEKATEKLWA